MDPLEIRRTRSAKSNAQKPLRETASQTGGPYVHIGSLPNMAGIKGIYAHDFSAQGKTRELQTISISGLILDGEKKPCTDAILELWQADENGGYNPGIWRRAGTDFTTGIYGFKTLMPGSFQDEEGKTLSPFINIWIAARGVNIGLLTRIYFPQHGSFHKIDPHLALVHKKRQRTLMAQPTAKNNEYRFDVHLQGPDETVFFNV